MTSRWNRRSRGQALTELALVLPLLAVLFVGILDLGRAYHTQVAASNAARVGLLYAQQVASPRMLDCTPGTTCYFIRVSDIINVTKQEAQGGIDPAQMQVNVCLQNTATCPVTDTSEAVASNEAITVSVTVPFTAITPFVHLTFISGAVSGQTFPFEPAGATMTAVSASSTPTPTSTPTGTATSTPTTTATATDTPTGTATATATTTATPTQTSTPAPTSTPGGPPTATPTTTATPTNTPTSTATSTPTGTATGTPTNTATAGPTNTSTPEPVPTITAVAVQLTGSGASEVVTISWLTQYPAQNDIYYRSVGSTIWNHPGGTSSGSGGGSNTFGWSSRSGAAIIVGGKGTYQFYLQSATTGGTTTYPSSGASCTTSGSQACPTFTL